MNVYECNELKAMVMAIEEELRVCFALPINRHVIKMARLRMNIFQPDI